MKKSAGPRIKDSPPTRPDIEFFYNSAGQRIMKIVKPNGGTGAMTTWKYTIWAYDLGGNVMAEYGIDYITASNKYTINAKSHFLYGAGRLGKDLRDSTDYVPPVFRPVGPYTQVQSCTSCATDAVAGAGSYLYGPTVVHTRQLGYKQFELSNHTGNILMVVTDRKNAVDIGTWVPASTAYNTASFDRRLDYYVADVVEVTDYYPGGMPMPGRSILDAKFGSFRWGHNGQYNDDEIYGKGNTQMAEFWEYDARLMRRWNTDPMAHAGQSLYEAFYSNPIAFADPLGLKPESGGEGGPGKKGDSSTSDESVNMSTYCSDCDPEPTDKSPQQYTPPKRLNGWQRFWNVLNGKRYLNEANNFLQRETSPSGKIIRGIHSSYEGKGFIVYQIKTTKLTLTDGENGRPIYTITESLEKHAFTNSGSDYDKVEPNLLFTEQGIFENGNWLVFTEPVGGTISIDPTSVGPGKVNQIRNFIKFAKEFKGIFNSLKKGATASEEINGLLKAGNALDKGGFTTVGRSLQKHGSRVGSIYPKATGNPANINAQGEAVLKGILTNPNVTRTFRHHARFGNIMDIRIPGGQGVRFSADGKTFIHFIEP